MKIIWLLFISLCLIPVSESCLVVRTKECACQNQMLSLDNLSIVSDHPFYGNLTKQIITEPTVTGEKCSISILCDDGYELVILDKQTTTNFGQYSADGICQASTQTWLVSDNAGFKMFQVMNAVCVHFKAIPVCTPDAPATFLFAYSSDTEGYPFLQFYENAVFHTSRAAQFTKLGTIRFDVEEEEDIQYFSDTEEWLNTWTTTYWPNASLSFPDPYKTDIIKVINKHLLNTEAPVCGTRMTIVMGRPLPRSTSLHIASTLQAYNISLFTISPVLEDGRQSVMSTISEITGGYGFDHFDMADWDANTMPLSNPYVCIYKLSVEIFGSGELNLPKMNISTDDGLVPLISSSIYFDDTTVLILKWSNNDVPISGQLENNMNYYAPANAAISSGRLPIGSYDMKLVYAVKETQTVTVKVYVNYAHFDYDE